ncbi:hypothetical protein [Rhodococcus sp. NPDC059234]|uniref:hypothetical protein n=1 Tax=Rhodococcus sp. NPDC059234 TaxID=3346781 RepID=UPI003671B91C
MAVADGYVVVVVAATRVVDATVAAVVEDVTTRTGLTSSRTVGSGASAPPIIMTPKDPAMNRAAVLRFEMRAQASLPRITANSPMIMAPRPTMLRNVDTATPMR